MNASSQGQQQPASSQPPPLQHGFQPTILHPQQANSSNSNDVANNHFNSFNLNHTPSNVIDDAFLLPDHLYLALNSSNDHSTSLSQSAIEPNPHHHPHTFPANTFAQHTSHSSHFPTINAANDLFQQQQQQQQQQQNFGQLSAHSADADVWISHGLTAPNTNSNSNSNSSAAASGYATPMVISSQGGGPGLNMGASTGSAGLATPSTNSFSFDPVAGSAHLHLPPARCIHETEEQQQQQQQLPNSLTPTDTRPSAAQDFLNANALSQKSALNQDQQGMQLHQPARPQAISPVTTNPKLGDSIFSNFSPSVSSYHAYGHSPSQHTSSSVGAGPNGIDLGAGASTPATSIVSLGSSIPQSFSNHGHTLMHQSAHQHGFMHMPGSSGMFERQASQQQAPFQQQQFQQQQQQQQQQSQQMQAQQAHQSFNGIPSSVPPSFHFGLPTTANALQQQQNGQDGASNGTIMIPTLHSPMGAAPNSAAAVSQSASKHRRHKSSTSTSPVNIRRAKERSQSRNRASMAAHGHAGSAAGSAASATGSTLGKRNSPAISVGAHGFDEDVMLRDGHAELEIAGGGSVGKAPSSRARLGRRSSIGPAAKAAGARGRSGSNASRPGLSNPVQHSQSQPGASPASPSTEGSIRQPTSPTNVFPTGSFLHQAVIAGVESGASSAHESPLSSSAHNSSMQHQQYNHPYGMMMMNNAHGTTTTGSNASSLFEGSVGGGAGGGGSMFIPHQQPQQGQNPTAATLGAPGSASSSTAHLQAQQQFAFRSASASLSPASSTGDGVEANANVPNQQQQQFQGFPTHHHLHMHRFQHHHHHHLPSASLQSVVEESGGTSANVSGVMMAPASSGDVTMQSLVKRERDGTSLDHDMESSSSLLQNRSSGAATGDGDGAEVFDYDAAEDDGDEDFVDEEDEDEEGESEGEDTRRGVRRGSQGGRRPSKQQQQQQQQAQQRRNDDTHDDDHAHSDVETGGGGVHKISSSSKGPQVSKASRSTTAAAAKKTTTTTRAKAGGARDDQATAHTAAAGKEDLSKATKGRKRAVSTAKRGSVSIPPSTPSSSTAAPFKTSSKNAGGVGNPANGDSRAMQVSSQMDELAEQGRGDKVELGEASKQGVGKKVRVSAKDKDPEAEAKRLAERRRRRRESHNAVERRRRDNINEKITELATLLPEAMLVEAIATSTSGGNSGNFDIAAAVKTLESASAGVAAAAARLGGSGFGHGLSSSSHHAAAAAAAGSKSIHGGENEGDEDEGNFLAGLLPPLMHELHGEDGDQLDNGQTAGAIVGASAGTGAMMLLSPQTALAGLPSLSISGGETTMQDDDDQTGKQAMLYPNNILSGYGSSSSTGIQAAAAASAATSSSVALPLSDGMSLAMSTAIPRHISSWAAAQAAAAKDPSAAMTNPTLAYAAALAPVHRDSAALAAAQAKPNKGIILRKSVDYIRHLQQFLDMQMGINRVLENEVLALRRCVAGSGHGEQQEHQMSSPPAQQPQYQQVRSQPLTKLASNLPIQDGQRSSSTNQTRPMDASAIFGTVDPFSTQGSGMDDSTASAAAAAAVDMMASGPGLGSNGTTHRGRRASPLPTVAPADSGIGASNLDRWLNFDMRTGLPRRPSLEPLADRMLGTDHSDTSPGADAGPMLASSTAFDPTMGDNGDEPLMSSHAPDLQRKGRDQKRSAHHQQQQHVGQPVSQPMATSHSASAAITTTAPPVEVERGRSRTRSFHPALPVGLGAGSQSSVPTQEGSWPELKASAALSRATSQDRVPSARMTPAGFGSQSRVASLGRMGNPSSPPLASFSDHSLGGGGHAGFANLHRQGSMLGFVGLGLDDLFGQQSQSQSQSQHSSGAEGGNGSGGNTNHTSGGLVAMEE